MKRAALILILALSSAAAAQTTQPAPAAPANPTPGAQIGNSGQGGGGIQQFDNQQFQRRGFGNNNGNFYQNFNDQRQGRRRNGGFGGNGGNGGNGQYGMFGAASTEPDSTPMPPSMTGNWAMLTERSIFLPTGFLPSDNQQPDQQTVTPPEDRLVLVGIYEAIGMNTAASPTTQPLVAFVEDNDSGQVAPLKVGDAIAGGKVLALSLEEMDFQLHGIVQRLEIGQNLSGSQIWGVSTTATALPPTLNFSGQYGDVLKAMALRRQKELSGGK
jgi:hypothetical protein